MYILGQEVYFIDTKARDIKFGRIIAQEINQEGYIVNSIKTEDKVVFKENAYIFETEDFAKDQLTLFLPVHDRMIEMASVTQSKIDELRLTVLGKPEFAELAE